MTLLIYPFLALAAVGFVAMLVVHVASLFGATYLFEHFLEFLGPGVFVVFLPTIFVMNRLTRDFKQKDTWRAALRGCPPWIRRAVWVIFGYVMGRVFRVAPLVRRWHGFGYKQSSFYVGSTPYLLFNSVIGPVFSDTGSAPR